MKILKLKSILFSLMAVVMVTVFLTSCEEDKLPLPTDDDVQKIEILSAIQDRVKKGEEITFSLPAELEDADDVTIQRYLNKMTTEQIEERELSYKIEIYLESIGSIEKVYNELGTIDLLTQSDLVKYTSEQELADFNAFDVNSLIESRWCYKQEPSGACIQGVQAVKRSCCNFRGCKTKIVDYILCWW